jgi:two-component system response regulator RegX3
METITAQGRLFSGRDHVHTALYEWSWQTGEIDAVVALEVGADDYVTKPYRLHELIARIRAALRRAPLAAQDGESVVLEVGDVRLDPQRHELLVRGELVALPLKEFELLEQLLANPGRVLTRETLIDRIWGSDYVGDTKTLDVHIKRLRAKVEPIAAAPTRILTVRGLGYKYAAGAGHTPQLDAPRSPVDLPSATEPVRATTR